MEIKKFDFSDTENWKFKGAFFHCWPETGYWQDTAEMILADIEEKNNAEYQHTYTYADIKDKISKDSRYAIKGTCDHCGAAFNYGAVYKHCETDEWAVVGHICATTSLK